MDDKFDYTFCTDYDKNICPVECFRAKITEQYDSAIKRPRVSSWATFRDTPECPLGEESC